MISYRLIVVLYCCFFIHYNVFSQAADVIDVSILTEMSNRLDSNKARIKAISSPIELARSVVPGIYLDSEWQASTVFSKSNDLLSCSARYNIHKNRMEIKLDDGYRTLQANQINGVVIFGALFIYLSSGEESMSSIKSYYEVLSDGWMTLLKKYNLELYNTGGTSLHPNLGTQQEFRSNSVLYYAVQGQGALALKRGKKNIEQLFGDRFEDAISFAKEKGIGFKKEKDIIQLFDWYNSIQLSQNSN